MHQVDALAITGEEGRVSLRKAWGSWHKALLSRDVRMGKPTVYCTVSMTEFIGHEKRTRRTEPSKYPEEKKSTEIP